MSQDDEHDSEQREDADPAGTEEASWKESDLLELFHADREEAIRQLDELRAQLTRYLYWDCSDPDEVAQEAIHRGMKRFREQADMSRGVRAYFFGIARNLTKEEWKPKRTREQQLDGPAWERRSKGTRDVQAIEARIFTRQLLSALSVPDRRTILLYVRDGPQAAARELGASEESVRVMVCRIRKRLRQMRDELRSVPENRKRSGDSRHGEEAGQPVEVLEARKT